MQVCCFKTSNKCTRRVRCVPTQYSLLCMLVSSTLPIGFSIILVISLLNETNTDCSRKKLKKELKINIQTSTYRYLYISIYLLLSKVKEIFGVLEWIIRALNGPIHYCEGSSSLTLWRADCDWHWVHGRLRELRNQAQTYL